VQEHMRDAAFAANIPTPWSGAVGGYLNAKGDPFHPWTAADWARFHDNRKLPIFVQSNPDPNRAEFEALRVLDSLYTLRVPRDVYIALDLETAVSPAYVLGFGSVLHWAGFHTWVYGSASTVFKNPPLRGYWVADYLNGEPFEFDHPDVLATQYTDNPPADHYDSSTVKPWIYQSRHWWR
jgi:hypothetical protein